MVNQLEKALPITNDKQSKIVQRPIFWIFSKRRMASASSLRWPRLSGGLVMFFSDHLAQIMFIACHQENLHEHYWHDSWFMTHDWVTSIQGVNCNGQNQESSGIALLRKEMVLDFPEAKLTRDIEPITGGVDVDAWTTENCISKGTSR